MKELLHYLISNILPESTDIKIEEEEDGETVVLNLIIPEEDRGRVIGKNGINIKAIRNIVSIRARRENKRVMVKILD